jgi:molybdopterin/thiamine biosynthesis adenylyltransferase
MAGTSTDYPGLIRLFGKPIPEAIDRQVKIPGFDQERYSKGRALMIGAGGLGSHIAPTLVRKGIGKVSLLDHDTVSPSNLNRQRFYERDIGDQKVGALARNLLEECVVCTEIEGWSASLEQALEDGYHFDCDIVIVGVDNNPARVIASRHFRDLGLPVIFTAVSADADHGYVFVQEKQGPCIGCLFPDMVNDDRYPCPGTPAIADVLQAVGALAAYAVDSILTDRPRNWNYRRISLSGPADDGAAMIRSRPGCPLCNHK